MKKKLWIVLGVVLLVVVVVGAGVWFYVDTIARRSIERAGTYATGVETEVEDADVRIFAGELTLDSVSIANPQGYQAPHFLELDKGFVSVGLGSLMEDQVEVPQLNLTGLHLWVERTGEGNNFDVILDHLRNLSSGPPREGGKKYVIREMVIENVVVDISGYGVGTKPVALPTIRLTDVGTGGEGKALEQVVGIVIREVLQSLLTDPSVLPDMLASQLDQGLEGLGNLGEVGVELIGDVTERAGKVLEDVGEAAEGTTEKVGEGLKDVKEGLGGLLGGDKQDEEEETAPE